MNKNYFQSVIAMIVVSFICGWLLGSGRLSSDEKSNQTQNEEVFVSTTIKPPTTTSSSSTTTTEEWNPENYTVVAPEQGIAVRWLDSGDYKCDYYDWCWGMEVISRWGCSSSLYAEINLFDKNNVNVGWTNDTTQRLSPGDKAILVFGTYESTANSAKLAKISCY